MSEQKLLLSDIHRLILPRLFAGLLLVYYCRSSLSVQGFTAVPNNRGGASLSDAERLSAMTPLSLMQQDSAPTTVDAVPNWRILRQPKYEHVNGQDKKGTALTKEEAQYVAETVSILSKRPAWSEECYQNALSLFERLTSCTDSYVSGPIDVALNSLDHAYRLYGPESVICSFNGGKDAVVILYLVLAAHANYFHHLEQTSPEGTKIVPIRPRVLYFENKDEFPEVSEFVRDIVDMHDLDMIAFEEGIGFSQGLRILVDHNYLQTDSNNDDVSKLVPHPLSFVLGTRTTDPNAGKQGHFAPSSHYMPPFMRVNPVIDWSYGHVWHFLRTFQIPYCVLYDRGYTSLGNTKDTLPCPALAVAGNSPSVPKYWPAYMLRDWDQERAGRIDRKKKPAAPQSVDVSEHNSTNSHSSQISGATALGPASTISVDDHNASKNEISHDIGQDKLVANGQMNGATVANSSAVIIEDSFSVKSLSTSTTRKTVGILIIGDEILKGYTADTNTHAAATALRDHNVLLKRVAVVSDDLEDICEEIARMRNEVDVIITSGGVGPTHDDVTMKSVAAALNCEVTLHTEMLELLKVKMSTSEGNVTEAQLKMAMLPQISKLRYLSDDENDWPVLQCRNIFILPGIPEYFEQKIGNVARYLSCQLRRGLAYKVVLSIEENVIVPILNQVVEKHTDVVFGSYPFVNHPEMKTVITVEGRLCVDNVRKNSSVFDTLDLTATPQNDIDRQVQMALDELITLLPEGSVLRVDNEDMALSFN